VSLYQKIDALRETEGEFSTNVPALCMSAKLIATCIYSGS